MLHRQQLSTSESLPYASHNATSLLFTVFVNEFFPFVGAAHMVSADIQKSTSHQGLNVLVDALL